MKNRSETKFWVIIAVSLILGVFIASCQAGAYPEGSSPTAALLSPSATPTYTPIPTPVITSTPVGTPTQPPPDFSQFPGRIEYIIPLTLQYVGQDSAMAYFELDQPAAGYVFVWPEGEGLGAGRWIPIDPSNARQLIPIPDLEPGRTYNLSVGLRSEGGVCQPASFAGQAWDPIQFVPLDLEPDHIRIGVIGDSGFGEELTRQLADQMASRSPDFVIHTGDVVYKVEEEGDPTLSYHEKYFQIMASLLHKSPIYPVPGNHEYDLVAYKEGIPYYFHVFPPILKDGVDAKGSEALRNWYALELGNIQIIFLNSQLLFFGQLIDEQTEWFAQRLNDDRFDTTIVILHVPPFSSSIHRQDGYVVKRYWDELLTRPEVSLVISGHEHVYERLRLGEVTYLISGGGSSVLYTLEQAHPGQQFFSSESHFVLLDIFPDHMKISAIGLDGNKFDFSTIELTR